MNVTAIGEPIFCSMVGQLPYLPTFAERFAAIPLLSRLMNTAFGANGAPLYLSAYIFMDASLMARERVYQAIQERERGNLLRAVHQMTSALILTSVAIYEAVAVTRRFC